MATQTQHFNLTKPDWEDRASISVLNANTDIIDAQMYDNEQSAANAIGNMAAEYDDTATYEVGDFCIYSEVLYKCVTAVSVAEAFDGTKWTQTTAAENFGSGGGGGSATLAGLTDVNLTSPTDGQALVYDGANQKWVNGAGGGGNANERVLTRAEYEALTDAEKLNGTTYYINDAVPEGKEIQPVIYSTEEREVGVWADGKPLYQKTLEISVSTSSANTFVSAGVTLASLFIDKLIKGQAYDASGQAYPANMGKLNGNTDIGFALGIANRSITALTIQYTKTTDTAGSGVWTTSGVPAVHYSTEEQIVGTWIDGKPLYQKTYSVVKTNPSTNAWITLASLTGMGIDKVIKCDGIAHYVSGSMDRTENTGTQLVYMYNYLTSELCALQSTTSNATATFVCTIQYTKSA